MRGDEVGGRPYLYTTRDASRCSDDGPAYEGSLDVIECRKSEVGSGPADSLEG